VHDDFDMIVAIANGGIVPAGIINQRYKKKCICCVSI
jgi:Predicted phosphoribosyltransferases